MTPNDIGVATNQNFKTGPRAKAFTDDNDNSHQQPEANSELSKIDTDNNQEELKFEHTHFTEGNRARPKRNVIQKFFSTIYGKK